MALDHRNVILGLFDVAVGLWATLYILLGKDRGHYAGFSDPIQGVYNHVPGSHPIVILELDSVGFEWIQRLCSGRIFEYAACSIDEEDWA